ncbi:MAG: hypothetical protein ACOX8S_09025 [Christensenellales bacterium]|jgi:chromosome segregation ATPase
MDNKTSALAINELRESLPKIEKKIFKKNLLGGYNLKEVQEHINFMNDRLKQADVSYINQLDEHNATVAMLSQERDKLREQLDEAQAIKNELEKSANLLYLEKKELMRRNRELEAKAAKADEYMAQMDAQRLETDMLKKQCADYLDSNKQLQAELSHAREGNSRPLSGAAEGGNSLDEYDQVKKQYEEAVIEKNGVIAEKDAALEKCKEAQASLDEMYARNRELWNENSLLKLKIRNVMNAHETKTRELSHKHMKNTDEIRVCINTIMDLIDSEGADIAKMTHIMHDAPEGEDAFYKNNEGK